MNRSSFQLMLHRRHHLSDSGRNAFTLQSALQCKIRIAYVVTHGP